MDELDLTEKTPRTFDEDDLHDEGSHLAVFTSGRVARGTKSNPAMASVPPPVPRSPRAATIKPMVGSATVPPSKLISFLPPPEPQSPVPGSFPVVRGSTTAAPPPVPTTPRVRASSTLPPPSSVRHATSVGPQVPRTVTPGYDPASVGSRSTIGEPLARGSIAPRTSAAREMGSDPISVRRSDAMDAVDIAIDVAPFAADEPHVAGTPMTDDKHVALPPIANADEVTDDIDRSTVRPRRSVAAIAGVAVGAALVLTTIGLMIRGSGTKPAPAPPPATLATTPASPSPTAPSSSIAPAAPIAPAPPSRPPAVEVAATTSAAAAAPAPVEPAEDEPPHADLPITSQPDGAIVTLIANGDATVVGRTPITATIDPTLTYDVVFALRDHPTMIAHIDASKVHELAIDLTPRPTPPPARRRTKVVIATKPKTVATKTVAPKPVAKPAPRTR